jgi:hypothetical protein
MLVHGVRYWGAGSRTSDETVRRPRRGEGGFIWTSPLLLRLLASLVTTFIRIYEKHVWFFVNVFCGLCYAFARMRRCALLRDAEVLRAAVAYSRSRYYAICTGMKKGHWVDVDVEIARASVGGIISLSFLFLSCPSLAERPFRPALHNLTHLLCRRIEGCADFAFTPSLAGVNQSLIPQRSSSERNRSSTRSVIHPLVTFSLGLA